ncbi:hypothetical protein D1AOALGA4SA_5511 [Olavius algarvensis Delta 1 endosymbiont]|nr:hypothetical protein D1AOALGA4SA_5511 [Olavius algarvensis Delta 1 endosymbiont]
MRSEKNVMGTVLESCSLSPRTGFKRDGMCRSPDQDLGVHGVCSVVTEAFLNFTKSRGNDLSSANPHLGFPGLAPGDRWCLCASRWKEAMNHGKAPPVVLSATSEVVLDYVSLEVLLKYAEGGDQPH